jgi:hypothetical protein
MSLPDVNFSQNASLLVAKRKNPATYAVRHDPLLPPWAVKYAIWLVTKAPTEMRQRRQRDGFYATTTERRVRLQTLTQSEWATSNVKMLERRPDFQELIGKLAGTQQEAIRTALEANGYRYVEVLEDSVNKLHGNEDYKTAGELALKAIGHILPKTPDAIAATAITVNISAKQLEGIESDAITVEATPID